jgi:hypothetical protein
MEPKLTDLFLTALQEQGYSFFLLLLDLPQVPGVDDALAVAPRCFAEPPRRTDLA